ncbi:MAG: hypothetical protein V4641_16300 [Pseudomonadota bacterium]
MTTDKEPAKKETYPVARKLAAIFMSCTTDREAHMLSIFRQLDARGQDAMINCGVFHMRYPKEKT